MLAVGANSTATMAALRTMRTDLFVNAYLVVSAACIVFGGQAADRFGARLTSMVGLTLFGVASAIIAAAGTQDWLLAGRALRGLAAAFPDRVCRAGCRPGPATRASGPGFGHSQCLHLSRR
jgi:MFS family permease